MSWHGQYVPKKAYFGPKMAVFGPNILIILGGSKTSGTHISENYLCGTTCRAWDHLGQKKYLAKHANFGPNLALFVQKIHFWGGGSKTLGTLISGTPLLC